MVNWVTGAKGFIGRHVARFASCSGNIVSGVGHGAWPEADAASWGVGHWLNGDVSQSNLDRLARYTGLPSVIYHLAGASSVGFSLLTPEEDFRRTVDSTCQLLEWVRNHAPQARIVMASSAAVYGDVHAVPIKETDLLRPFSPYGYHKRMAELLCESYVRNFGLSVVILRFFSVYGTNLRKQLLWDLCRRLQTAPASLTLDGSGDEMRDWLHVEDAASFLVRAAQFDISEIYINGGTGCGVTVREIAESVVNAWGVTVPLHFTGLSRSGDPSFLVADVTKSRIYGMLPGREWQEGILEYVNWFRREGAAL